MELAVKLFLYPTSLIASVLCVISLNAQAASVSILSDNATDWSTSTLPTTTFNPAWSPLSSNVAIQTGSASGVYRSPFEDAATPGTGVGNWASLQYTSVQGGGQAIYNFVGTTAATDLSLIWGSPDSYNTIAFYSGKNGTGTLIDQITGSALLNPPGADGLGHQFVVLNPGQAFGSIVLSSSANAFEFANLTTTPLPGALVLFGSVLAGAGACMRRRRDRLAVPSMSCLAADVARG
jgi:hypothetical protein